MPVLGPPIFVLDRPPGGRQLESSYLMQMTIWFFFVARLESYRIYMFFVEIMSLLHDPTARYNFERIP